LRTGVPYDDRVTQIPPDDLGPVATDGVELARPYRTSALPPVGARVLAFVAILLGGLCGGLIGWSVVDIQCGPSATVTVDQQTRTTVVDRPADGDDSGCGGWAAGGGLGGALVGAGGVGIVAVLVLRAMAEWRRNLDVDEPPLP
jgi:hypothetical protein